MKIALVHESLTQRGGAERVLEELIRIFPEAPVYTLRMSRQDAWGIPAVATSFLQRLPASLHEHRLTLPFYPVAPETFDLSEFDVILSSASAFAKGIVTRPGSLHICYCHAPTRFLWDATHEVLGPASPRTWRGRIGGLVFHGLRLWDQTAARRVDAFIANSETTRARIRKYYGRDSVVIYPPVNSERFNAQGRREPDSAIRLGAAEPRRKAPSGKQGMGSRERRYFLYVGRLSPYKHVGLLIETFNKLELPLLIAGKGRALPELRKRARKHVLFCGFVPDDTLAALYAGARAVVFPSDDDFGLVPVEAMAAGTPVLALRRGGATETVIEGVTGEFFDEPIEELLADCVRRFLEKEHTYRVDALRARAAQFSADRFRERMHAFVTQAWEEWNATSTAAAQSLNQGRLLNRQT